MPSEKEKEAHRQVEYTGVATPCPCPCPCCFYRLGMISRLKIEISDVVLLFEDVGPIAA